MCVYPVVGHNSVTILTGPALNGLNVDQVFAPGRPRARFHNVHRVGKTHTGGDTRESEGVSNREVSGHGFMHAIFSGELVGSVRRVRVSSPLREPG